MGEEASANVDSQKKNNLSMDGSNRGFLPHNYPNKMRMLKNYGSGGGECDKACGITMGIVCCVLFGIMIIIYIIYPSYLSKRSKPS